MTPAEIQSLIQNHLPGCTATVNSNDNVHFDAVVVSMAFAGKRALQRHRIIYGALGTAVGGDIHALSIQAYTPEEWDARPADAPAPETHAHDHGHE
jgi:acid stress-induced BolA-like protein IbaG/YrbA